MTANTGDTIPLDDELVGRKLDSTRLPVGQEVGYFCLEQKIGEGGFGAVYYASDTRIDEGDPSRPVVAKVSSTPIYEGSVGVWDTVKALDHPHLAKYEESYQVDGLHVVTMERVHNGITISQHFENMHNNGGSGFFDSVTALRTMKSVAEALRYLHTQKPPIIHGDIGPHNVMINGAYVDVPNSVKLIDLGAMEVYMGENEGMADPQVPILTARNLVFSPHYSSPEKLTSPHLTHLHQ